MASFFGTLNNLYKLTVRRNSSDNSTEPEDTCISSVHHQLFHLWLLLPSSIMIFLMALTIRRKRLYLNIFDGRPGAIFPMDILSRSNRFSYVAAWGTIAYLVTDAVLNKKFAVKLEGKSYVTAGNALLSMIIYGVDYFPLFASLALNSLFGYIVGTVYVWMLFLLTIYKEAECDLVYQARLIYFLRDMPLLLCLGYLSISLPVRMVRTFRKSSFSPNLLKGAETSTFLRRRKDVYKTPEGVHVRKILALPEPPPPKPTELKDKIIAGLKDVVATVFYLPLKGFRYSARVLSVTFIGVLLLYKTSLEFLVLIVTIFSLLEGNMIAQLDEIGWDEQPGDSVETSGMRMETIILYNLSVTIKGCLIAAIVTSLVLGLVQILHMLSSYRTNLLALYKGDTTHIPPRDGCMKASLLVGTMKYAGFQVGYIAWGFVVHALVFFTIAAVLAVVILLLMNDINQWLVDLIKSLWPVILVSLIVNYGQLLLAKYVFLQESGEQLALENRRVLFILSFFLFFYNIFIGLVSCLLRIVKSIVIGAVFLSRLDNSALPRRFQMMDPGFTAYVGFMHIEAVHANPIQLVFLRLLMKQVHVSEDDTNQYEECKSSPEGQTKTSKNGVRSTRSHIRWHLAYTLLHNPQLRTLRKSYLNRMREMQARLVKKYELSDNDAVELLDNMRSMNMEEADIDSKLKETDGGLSVSGTWGTVKSMVTLTTILKKVKGQRNAAGKDGNIELENMAGTDAQPCETSGVRQPSDTSLWTTIRKGGNGKKSDDSDDFSLV